MALEVKKEPFDLPVIVNGQEVLMPGILEQFGYSYRLVITIDSVDVCFEPDEERNFRALSTEARDIERVPRATLGAVLDAIHTHFR